MRPPPQLAHAPPIFIDALNLAYWRGDPPSLRMPLALLTQLLAADREAMLYFDASAPHRLSHEAGVYAGLLHLARHCTVVPSGRPADREMLRRATSSGACIVSKDRFRDHRRRYRKLIDDPARLYTGAVEGGRLLVPGLALDVPLPATADEAWRLHCDQQPRGASRSR